jgi:hypothetical protein
MANYKDALQLRPGDRIVVSGGEIERVAKRTTPGDFNTVTIHTDASDITTTLPCAVRLAGTGA